MAYLSNTDFLIEVAKGNVANQRVINADGIHTAVPTGGAYYDIWDNETTYVDMSVATTLYASSTNAGDTTQQVIVYGVSSSGVRQELTVTLNGQTQVQIGSGQQWTGVIERAEVISNNATAGDVYIASSSALTGGVPNTVSAIKARIRVANQAANNLMINIPSDSYGIVLGYGAETGNDDLFLYRLRYKKNGASFYRTIFVSSYAIGSSPSGTDRVPEKIEPGILKIDASKTSAGTDAFSGNLKILLVKN